MQNNMIGAAVLVGIRSFIRAYRADRKKQPSRADKRLTNGPVPHIPLSSRR
ncbi:MAG: hypothetical protein MJ061_07075 [Mailhella sp.]|nr:hypothetical protein [Mailhella sp.]